jgi:DNA-binding transcriptional LysR family regulator
MSPGRIHTDSGRVFSPVLWRGLALPWYRARCGAAEVRAKKLVPLLRDYDLDPVDIHAVFPGGPRPSAKVRAFMDFLAERLNKSGGQRANGHPRPRDRSGR